MTNLKKTVCLSHDACFCPLLHRSTMKKILNRSNFQNMLEYRFKNAIETKSLTHIIHRTRVGPIESVARLT